MNRLVIAFASLAVGGLLKPLPAHASVGLTCTISDENLDLVLEGSVSRGVGEGLVTAQGEVKTKIPLLSGEMTAFAISRENITQFWLGRQDLKMRIYRETAGEPHQEFNLVIEVRLKGDPDGIGYAGTYSANASSMAGVTTGEAKAAGIKGKVSCQVE